MSRYEDRNGLLVPSRRIVDIRSALRVNQLGGFNRRRTAVANPAITLVNSTSSPGTQITTPGTHASGDLFVIAGVRHATDVAISTPSGWTARGGNTSNNIPRVHFFSKVAGGSSETVTGFTSAQVINLWILRGADNASFIGDTDAPFSNAPPFSIGNLTLQNVYSWWLYCITDRTGGGTTTLDTENFNTTHPLLGSTNLRRDGLEYDSAAAAVSFGDSHGPWGSTTVSSISKSQGGTSTGRWRAYCMEIKAAPV